MIAWLREYFNGHPEPTTNAKFEAAMSATDDLIVASRSLNEQLRPFRDSPDPFGAIQRAAKLSAEWEKQQEAQIHKGPSR